jgi:ABC-type uncharacterized transport system involved in gliding motility auxiliary subunit
MNRSTASIIAVLLAAILFVAVNVFSNNALRSARLDLTEEGLYTLSGGSLNVIASVKEPIRLRLYLSEKLANSVPSVKSYGIRVRELLEEYANLSNGRIRLEVIDPEPFTEAEDDAVRLGMQALPLGQDNLYFGLVGNNTTDDQEVIPFFSGDKEQFLEYDLTRLIYNLTDPKLPVVGLITAHEMNANVNRLMRLSGGPEPWPIVEYLRESFDLRLIDLNQGPVDPEIDVLLIVHPPAFSDTELYRIDQYVLNGGRLVAYVDPHSEIGASTGRNPMRRGPPVPDRSDMQKLFNAWGFSVDPDKLVGDYATARQVNASVAGAPRIVRYLPWLELTGDRLNGDDVVTGDLGPIVLASAGEVKKTEGSTLDIVPLLTSSDQAMMFAADEIRFGPAPKRLLELFKADGVHHVMAARVTGSVKSAFPDGAPAAATQTQGAADKADGDSASASAHLAASKGPVNMIVVADADLLFEQFWMRTQSLMGQNVIIPLAANADMLVNALDNLAGSNDLIGLRSRGKSSRPFEVVETLRRAAEQKFLARERELTEKLEETQKTIAELETRAKAGGGALLSREQQQAIDQARGEVLKTRRKLRGVQHDLNRDIEALETRIKFANIGLIPIAVSFVALILAWLRYRRRQRRANTIRT